MSERRSGRSQKRVDYSKFSNEEKFSDSDDDFANPTPPPAKKAKMAKEPKKPKSSDKIKVTPDIAIWPAEPKPRTGAATKRMAPDEKEFQRELELAMEMSMMEDCPPPVLSPAEVVPPGENKENQHTSNPPSMPPVLVEADKIEILEENVSDSDNKGRSRRKSAKKIVESDDDEDDFRPEESSEEDDSDDDFKLPCESDSDDGRKKSKNTKKTKTPASSKKVQKTSTPKTNTKPVSKVSGRKPVNNKSVNSSSTSSSRNITGRPGVSPLAGRSVASPVPRTRISSPTLPTSLKKTPGGKTGNVTPALPRQPASSSLSSAQGNHLGGVSIKSPSGGIGVLRLGLSRRARITPLHSAAKQPS